MVTIGKENQDLHLHGNALDFSVVGLGKTFAHDVSVHTQTVLTGQVLSVCDYRPYTNSITR